MNLPILEAFYLFSIILAAIDVTNAFIRTGVTTYGHVLMAVEPHGAIVTKLSITKPKILYTEEFNVDTNPLKLHFNYYFENTGKRQIVEVDNLCADFEVGTKEYAAKLYMLKSFANTDECPIKKGTKAIFKLGIPYKYSINNPGCGFIQGSVGVFKNNSTKPDNSPLVFQFHYRAHITGPDC